MLYSVCKDGCKVMVILNMRHFLMRQAYQLTTNYKTHGGQYDKCK